MIPKMKTEEQKQDSVTTNIWTEYRVTWLFLRKLCGSVPADPELVKIWLESRQPEVRPADSKSINEIQEEVFNTLAEPQTEEQGSLLSFQRDKVTGQLVMREGTVRAHIKDCARNFSAQYIGKIKGERSFATRVVNGVYLDEHEEYIPILRPEGEAVLAADGRLDKAVHVRGPRGEVVNCLKSFEYVQPARMDFTLKILGNSVSRQDLEMLFQYSGIHGYAGERGDGEGKYTFMITEVK